MKEAKRFSLIGTGNVATWLARRIQASGGKVEQVHGRSREGTEAFARHFGADPVYDLGALRCGSDLYLFAVSDDAYETVIQAIPFAMPCAAHAAGALPISLFQGKADHFGAIYPLQTLSRSLPMDHLEVPLCIEGDSPESERWLFDTARKWSRALYPVAEKQRLLLHLAATFSSNFVNALYGIGYSLLEEQGVDPELLYPLWENTLRKAQRMPPREAQTGPARRGDRKTIAKHLACLPDESLENLYRLMTGIIQERTGFPESERDGGKPAPGKGTPPEGPR